MPKLNINSPFFRFMSRLGDLVLLNLTWLLCCLPVVTIGASTTALFYTARQFSMSEFPGVWPTFFHSFRQNLRQATLAWLILLVTGGVSLADLVIGLCTPGRFGNFCRGIGLVLLLLWIAVAGYIFPLLARYDYRMKQLFSGAFFLCFAHPTVTITSVALALWLPVLSLRDWNAALYCMPIWFLLGGSVSAVVLSVLLRPVFHKLENTRIAETD